MPEFDALGRDVAAAADSTFDTPVAGAVKALWSAAGFDQGDNPNHLWTVTADIQSDRFTVSATVKDGNVYVPPPYPSAPATVDELARQAKDDIDAVAAEASVPAPVAPPVDVPVIPDPAPVADSVPAPAAADASENAPVVEPAADATPPTEPDASAS